MALSISIVVPFLNMTKQFTGNISQVSNQVNSVVMGLAGTQRIFDLIDDPPEADDGYVTLVNAKEGADGTLEECAERTACMGLEASARRRHGHLYPPCPAMCACLT